MAARVASGNVGPASIVRPAMRRWITLDRDQCRGWPRSGRASCLDATPAGRPPCRPLATITVWARRSRRRSDASASNRLRLRRVSAIHAATEKSYFNARTVSLTPVRWASSAALPTHSPDPLVADDCPDLPGERVPDPHVPTGRGKRFGAEHAVVERSDASDCLAATAAGRQQDAPRQAATAGAESGESRRVRSGRF